MQDFRLGEYVFVPGHGVGQVLSCDEKIEGLQQEKKITYFQVKLVSTGAKVQVPVREGQSVLRPLVNREEVNEVYDFLSQRENIKFNRQTWNRRYRDYMAKINTGTLKEIAEVLREMLLIKVNKKLSFSEKRVLDMCKEMIIKEIAITTGSHEEQVSGTIDSLFNVQ